MNYLWLFHQRLKPSGYREDKPTKGAGIRLLAPLVRLVFWQPDVLTSGSTNARKFFACGFFLILLSAFPVFAQDTSPDITFLAPPAVDHDQVTLQFAVHQPGGLGINNL